MERPEKIYLEKPLILESVTINCTRDGLVFLIDHYEHVLQNIKPEQISTGDIEYAKQRIEDFKLHLILYDRNQGIQGNEIQQGV